MPFPVQDIGWKPQKVAANRCLAVAFLDARNVMDRLDQVVGVNNWQDNYTVLPSGCVVCNLSVQIGDAWVVKVDVGSPSDQDNEGDRTKAAFSDALKRAAVKYGIGRYLYSLPMEWVDYDPQKRQIVKPPRLPAWALPPDHLTAEAARQRLLKWEEKAVAMGVIKNGDSVTFASGSVKPRTLEESDPPALEEALKAGAGFIKGKVRAFVEDYFKAQKLSNQAVAVLTGGVAVADMTLSGIYALADKVSGKK